MARVTSHTEVMESQYYRPLIVTGRISGWSVTISMYLASYQHFCDPPTQLFVRESKTHELDVYLFPMT
jgi:hypothetical protein